MYGAVRAHLYVPPSEVVVDGLDFAGPEPWKHLVVQPCGEETEEIGA